MYPEETAWMEDGSCSPAAILQPHNELCYVTLNGSHKRPLTGDVIFKRKKWSDADVWLVQMNCRPEPGLNTPDPKKPVT